MAGALGGLRGGGRDTTCIEQSLLSVVGSWQSAAAAAECVEPEPLQNQPVLARSRELDERMRIPSQETGSWYPRNSRPRRRFPRPSLLGLRCSPPTNHLGSTRSGSCGGSKKVGWAGGTPPPLSGSMHGISSLFTSTPAHRPFPGAKPAPKIVWVRAAGTRLPWGHHTGRPSWIRARRAQRRTAGTGAGAALAAAAGCIGPARTGPAAWAGAAAAAPCACARAAPASASRSLTAARPRVPAGSG